MRAVSLYRAILKEHRNKLPSHMRMLGDDYVRNEFKQHKSAKPDQVSMFFTGRRGTYPKMHTVPDRTLTPLYFSCLFLLAWENYLDLMSKQEGRFGRDLDEDTKSNLNNEQRQKLQDLKSEAAAFDTTSNS